ncbi:hypothetical protein ACGFXC_07860 [Streptomyces sp. NPDC048507]|uniref:hypothetical protein n=1 Tax=Streptomyces sp. NPDC048507 TaxID=3365560 RepID=UPI003719F71C
MKLTKQFAAISVAATATVLFSAGGAQAQGEGEFLSFLGNAPLQQISYTVQLGDGNTYTGTQNNNTNNNSGKGTANNNNNNNNGGGSSSALGSRALQEISYPVQVGNGNNFIGTQNNNTNNNTGAGTYNNNNNNNNNGGGTFNNNNNNNNGGVNNNNNNNGGGTNNNNNNNNGKGAHRAMRALSSGNFAPLLKEAARANRQACSPSMGHIGQNSNVISGALKMHCAQN